MRSITVKVAKSFRFLPSTVAKIERVAATVGGNQTAAVELMISAFKEKEEEL